jgi:hypothetical protein
MINIAKLNNNFRSWQKFRNSSDPFWKAQWKQAINEQLKHLPHGNGINAEAGIQLDWENSTHETLRFNFSYQHMNDHGYYYAWTEHELIIRLSPTEGFNLQVTLEGEVEDKDETIEYLEEMLYSTFYYEPDYHKEEKRQTYRQLKKILTQKLVSVMRALKKKCVCSQ